MATGTVPITPGTGQQIAVDTNPGLAGGAAVQLMSQVNSDGTRQPNDPDGTLQVSPDPTTLILDDFGAQAITVFHTVASGNSGVVPSATAGNAAISAGTVSGGYAVMRTTNPFWLRGSTFLKIAHIVAFEAAATVNSSRWWGYGSNQATPTAALPVLNGAVFQLDPAAGALQAAIYSAGTKTVIATLIRPSDGLQHRYEIWYRQSVVYWVIDGLVVATKSFPNLAIATGLYAIAGSANAAAITAPTFNLSSLSVTDQGGNNRTISDGFNPSIQATVKAGSTAAANTDSPLVVAQHPASQTPAGTQLIGSVRIGSWTLQSFYGVTTATLFTLNVKTSSGQLHELTLSNPTATAAYVKLYNKNTSAATSDIPLATYRLAASGSAGDTLTLSYAGNGKVFTAGIQIMVSGGVAATDATATVAGIQISGSYV